MNDPRESRIFVFANDRKIFIRAITCNDAEDLYLDIRTNHRPFEAVEATTRDIQRMKDLGLKPHVTKAAKEAARAKARK